MNQMSLIPRLSSLLAFLWAILVLVPANGCGEAGKQNSNDQAAQSEPDAQTAEGRNPGTMADAGIPKSNYQAHLKRALARIDEGQFTIQDDTTKMRFGNLFSPDFQHLSLHENLWYISTEVKVFLLQEGAFEMVVSNIIPPYGSLRESTQDVNGDGLLDLVHFWDVHDNPIEISEVFLQKPGGSFREKIELENAEFDTLAKVVRGKHTGRDGKPTNVYKLRWNGYVLDTVEFIHYPLEEGGSFLRNKSSDRLKEGKALRELPKEYR